jgi:hypothetical protein
MYSKTAFQTLKLDIYYYNNVSLLRNGLNPFMSSFFC